MLTAVIGLASKLEYNWDNSGLIWWWRASATMERYSINLATFVKLITVWAET